MHAHTMRCLVPTYIASSCWTSTMVPLSDLPRHRWAMAIYQRGKMARRRGQHLRMAVSLCGKVSC
eukprot:6172878-Prorocentrum_lima.AAC.1